MPRLYQRGLTLVAVAAAAILIVGCARPGPTPSAADVHVENGTTRPVTVLVNDVPVTHVDPGTTAALAAGALPPGDWSIEALLPSGRSILELEVAADATARRVPDNPGGVSMGFGARADLSCGRLEIWVGAPMLGPAPEPGKAGDCD